MSDLAEFILACNDEDEAAARAVGPTRAWIQDCPRSASIETAEGQKLWKLESGSTVGAGALFDHVARHQPGRVLAECDARRRRVVLHMPRTVAGGTAVVCFSCRADDNSGRWHAAPCPSLRLEALPYADHPDYNEAWKP